MEAFLIVVAALAIVSLLMGTGFFLYYRRRDRIAARAASVGAGG